MNFNPQTRSERGRKKALKATDHESERLMEGAPCQRGDLHKSINNGGWKYIESHLGGSGIPDRVLAHEKDRRQKRSGDNRGERRMRTIMKQPQPPQRRVGVVSLTDAK